MQAGRVAAPTLSTRALCAMSPGLCSVGWRLVSMTSPSRRWRYTILPFPLLKMPLPPAALAEPGVAAAADLEKSCFATASRLCEVLRFRV